MKINKRIGFLFLCGGLFLGACDSVNSETSLAEQIIERPGFQNVSVHDPSVSVTEKGKYIIGSHLQFAKTTDLIQW